MACLNSTGEVYMLTTSNPSSSSATGKVYRIIDPRRHVYTHTHQLLRPRNHGQVLFRFNPGFLGFDESRDPGNNWVSARFISSIFGGKYSLFYLKNTYVAAR